MFIALSILFFLGSIATMFILIAPAMLSSQISREEEVKVNQQLTFANQIIVDAEFEECDDDRPTLVMPSSAVVRVSTYSPRAIRKAATGNRISTVDLYV